MKAIFKAFDLSKSRWIVKEEVNEFLDSIQGKIVSVQYKLLQEMTANIEHVILLCLFWYEEEIKNTNRKFSENQVLSFNG